MHSLLDVPKIKLKDAFHKTAAALPMELGGQLQNDPFAVQQDLLQRLGAQVSKQVLAYTRYNNKEEREYHLSEFEDYQREEAALLIKLERYSIIKACVDLQHGHMVEGQGTGARFKDSVQFDAQEIPDGLTDVQIFNRRLNNGYKLAGKEAVTDPQPWFKNAAKRNSGLFYYFVDTLGEHAYNQTPATTRDLEAALDGGALIVTIPHLVELVNDSPVTSGYSPQQKLQVARDLSYLGLRRADQNISRLAPIDIDRLKGEIIIIPEGPSGVRHVYSDVPVTKLPKETTTEFEERKKDAAAMAKAVFGYKTYPGNDEEGYPLTDIDETTWGTTLKCPVFQNTKKRPISNLQSQQHAALREAYDSGIFDV